MKFIIDCVVTDVEGCDAIETECEFKAHSFSEAVILLERSMTYKQRIIKINSIIKKEVY